jgi:hypothetical protein
MKDLLIAIFVLLFAGGTALADNHVGNALQHNNKTPQTFNPLAKDNGRNARDVPGRGAGQGSNPAERGNLGTPGAAKNGLVAPFR